VEAWNCAPMVLSKGGVVGGPAWNCAPKSPLKRWGCGGPAWKLCPKSPLKVGLWLGAKPPKKYPRGS